MKLRTTDVDMLHGKLLKKLLLFTLPIALSSIVQQIQPLSGISAMPMPWPQWGRIQKPLR